MCDESGSLVRLLAPHPSPGDEEALQRLKDTSESLRRDGNHFAAAYAMEQAAEAAWGRPDEMEPCAAGALSEYQTLYESGDWCSPQSLTALFLSYRLYSREYLFSADMAEQRRRARALLGEFAQRLVQCFEADENRENYLVRGFIVETDFENRFELEFPDYEVDWAVSSGGLFGLRFHLPSAFSLFRYLGDYELTKQIVDDCPDAFTTPGLRGWRAAVEGIVSPTSASERFLEAAEAFAEDIIRLPMRNEGAVVAIGATQTLIPGHRIFVCERC